MKLKKSWILIAAVALLLTFVVSGTIAYLAASTGELVNTFTPGEVKTDIEEKDKTDKTKPSIQIQNNGTVNVYVRVALVANWVKDGQIVAPWEGEIIYNQSAWELAGGYYYYKKILPAEGADITENLLASPITYNSENAPVEGAHLEVTVIHQSIQADGLGSDVTTAQQAFAKAAAQSN